MFIFPMCSLGTLVKNQGPNTQGLISEFPDSLGYILVFMPISHFLNYRYFQYVLKSRQCETLKFVIFKDCFGYSGSLRFNLNFKLFFYLYKNAIEILIDIALTL